MILPSVSESSDQDETYVPRDLLPRIGTLALDDVAANDFSACAEVVMKRGHGQAARRVRGVAKRMFDYATSMAKPRPGTFLQKNQRTVRRYGTSCGSRLRTL
jgi:hypothetical protein